MKSMIKKATGRMLSILLIVVLALPKEVPMVSAVSKAGLPKADQWDFRTENYMKSIYLSMIVPRTKVELAGFEIYRAPIKENGKKGAYRRIKTVKKIWKHTGNGIPYWKASYRDRDIVLGNSYAYKVRAYKEAGNKKIYSSFSPVRRQDYFPGWGSWSLFTDCSEKSISLRILLWKSIIKPTSFTIYRAPIKKNGKKGTFQKIKTVKKIRKYQKYYWEAKYEDFDVALGKTYAYKVEAYNEKIDNKKTFASFSGVKRAACGSEIGQYKCEVIKSSWDELIVKLTGKKKNKNGPLRLGKLINDQGILVGKTGESGEEKYIHLLLKKISLDGKKWYNEEEKVLTVQKGESIYLLFRDDDEHGFDYDNPVGPDGKDDIGIQNYTHAQIMKPCVIYKEEKMELRLNLTAGKAEVGDFLHWDSEIGDYVTEWDGDEFSHEIPQED